MLKVRKNVRFDAYNLSVLLRTALTPVVREALKHYAKKKSSAVHIVIVFAPKTAAMQFKVRADRTEYGEAIIWSAWKDTDDEKSMTFESVLTEVIKNIKWRIAV